MKNRRLVMRRAMSWLLTAVMTVGMLSATGVTAGAETVAETGAAAEAEPAAEAGTAAEEVSAAGSGSRKDGKPAATASDAKKEEAAEQFPEADAVIGIGNTKDIVDVLDHVLEGERYVCFAPKLDAELRGERVISTLPFFTYLKIAEGCSNCCTYCAIPMIRGKFRSVPMEDILKEARYLAENGVTELVVIAQDTAQYGKDLYGEQKLPELLSELCKIEGLRWIRTLYCYPERITDELLDVIAREDKLVKYLEIPIQHCNGDILKRMNRWGDTEKLEELFRHIREKVPGIILRTTLITGFPGETEEQFEELAEFVKRVRFDRLGCFAYSREEGTKAYDMPDQIDEETASHRADIIMEQQMLISCETTKNSWARSSLLWWRASTGSASAGSEELPLTHPISTERCSLRPKRPLRSAIMSLSGSPIPLITTL